MSTVTFTHGYIGNLAIDTGIDDAQWGYNLNTAAFPTYGGEVVQILSVYIDDLTLRGTVSSYAQMETIYHYFAAYFQTATQGATGAPTSDTTTSGAYNLQPMTFNYQDRGWNFQIYPKSAPGFRYGREVVAPTWQLQAFVIDDSPDLELIKQGIVALNVRQAGNEMPGNDTISLTGEISPLSGNPDTNPFETYGGTSAQGQQIVGQYSTYFNNLLNNYSNDNFSNLLDLNGASAPAPKPTTNPNSQGGSAGGAATQPGSTAALGHKNAP